MGPKHDKEPRRLVPRWRDFAITTRLGELGTTKAIDWQRIQQSPYFRAAVNDFRNDPNVVTASELVGASTVFGINEDVRKAAAYLKSTKEPLRRGTLAIVSNLLDPHQRLAARQTTSSDSIGGFARTRIKFQKGYLKDFPANPIAWIELARNYAILGQTEKAKTAAETALKLSRDNRYVLRSAARLAIHNREPDLALRMLRKAERSQYDPWLASAEIACSSVANEPPRLIAKGRQMLKANNWSAKDLSELRGAFATTAMINGEHRKGRQLVREGLIDPTDNLVAQAIWLNSTFGGVNVSDQVLDTPYGFEARVRALATDGKWIDAVRECERWQIDEPYSSGPAIFGSFYTTVVLEDFKTAEMFLRAGLRANPKEFLLHNNMAVALAHTQENLEAAHRHLETAELLSKETDETVTTIATRGLLCFRRGDKDLGRKYYRMAIELCDKHSLKYEKYLALLFFARQEAVEAPAESLRLYREAADAIKPVGNPEAKAIWRSLETRIDELRARQETINMHQKNST